jgi:hypothetical protein
MFIQRLTLLAGCLVLCSCAGLPEAEKASQLGEAIGTSGKVLREAVAANRTNAIRIGEEKQVSALLLAKDVSAGAAPDSEAVRQARLAKQSFTLRDAPQAYVEGLRDSAQIQAVKALEEYGDALKEAITGGTIEKLEQASAKLGDAVGTIVGAASPIAAPIAGPALKTGARLAGALMGSVYANEIQAIITARDDDVQLITKLLKADMARIAKLLAYQAKDFEIRRKANLILVSDDPNVDRLRLYNEYFVARKDAASIRALAAAANRHGEVLDALATAHKAVATADPSGAALLKRFIAMSDDLAALIKAARKESEQ